MEAYINLLYNKYKKMTLTRKQLAAELNIGLSSLDNLLLNNQLPIKHHRVGNSQKAKYVFPLIEVARYLSFENYAAA